MFTSVKHDLSQKQQVQKEKHLAYNRQLRKCLPFPHAHFYQSISFSKYLIFLSTTLHPT